MSKSIRNVAVLVTLIIVVGGLYWYQQSKKDETSSSTIKQSKVAENEPVQNKVVAKQAIIKPELNSAACTADPNWFPHSQTKRTNDAAFVSSSNCVFHQWAWQNFLWLTQDVNGEPRFMSFKSPESLLGLESEGFLPRMTKRDSNGSFDEFLQAGTDGIFVGHNNRAVYYSQYLDDTFVGFIEDNKLTNPDNLRALVKADPTTTFPITGTAGSMELKASWVIVDAGDDTSGMFTTETKVSKLRNGSNGIELDRDQVETVTVALVGFHIGGIVEGHPEMIWATFEHNRNAPNVKPGMNLEEPVSDQDFTFYTANTELADCNINYSSSNKLTLDETTQKLSPITQVCRQYQFGNEQGVNTGNDVNIASLNESVESLLDDEDVWKNYQEVGAIWFNKIDGLKPGMSLATDENLTGSLRLSNSTIETFTQVATTENNCFRCHNSLQQLPQTPGLEPLPASNLNISHALLNIYFWSQEDAQPVNTASGEES
ncbi:hypothetical protein [Marinicella rhabdoformis]|uniref:hypothetical protein n=1 Tax=Marinicella rhabdoformis TaxID=2580566 RepID=UPI0012AECA4B|nr:hypothetical protein [Marinicella rhabdoformis]